MAEKIAIINIIADKSLVVSEGSKEKAKYRDTNNTGMNIKPFRISFRNKGNALFIGINSIKKAPRTYRMQV
jgi:hypothetical protein